MVGSVRPSKTFGRKIKDHDDDIRKLYGLVGSQNSVSSNFLGSAVSSGPAGDDNGGVAKTVGNLFSGAMGFIPVIETIGTGVIDIFSDLAREFGIADVMVAPESGTDDDLVTINSSIANPEPGQRLRLCGTNILNTIHIKDTGNIIPFGSTFDLIGKNVVDFFWDVTQTKWVQTSAGNATTTGGGTSDDYAQPDVTAHGNQGGPTLSIDLASTDGHAHTLTATGDIAISFSNYPASGKMMEWEVWITQDSTGDHAITWPAEVVNPPTVSTTADTVSAVVFHTHDNGTTVYAVIVQNAQSGIAGANKALSNLVSPVLNVGIDCNLKTFSNWFGWAAAAGQQMVVDSSGLTGNMPNGDTYKFRINAADQFEVQENNINVHNNSLTNYVGYTTLAGQTVIMDTTGELHTLPLGDLYDFKIDGTSELSIGTGAIGMNSPLSMNSNKITSVTDPTAAQDVATKNYVDNSATAPFDDATPIVKGSIDGSKRIRFEVDGLTTAVTRVITPLDADMTLVGETNTQELSNKTLETPLIKDTDGTPTADRKLDVKDGILGTYSGAVETRAISNSSIVQLVNADISGIAAIDKTKIDGFASGGRWQKGDLATETVFTDQVNNFTQQQTFGGSGTSMVVTNGANFNGEVNFNDTIQTDIEILDGKAVKGESGANIGHLVNDVSGSVGSLGTVQIPVSTTGIASASVADSRFGNFDGAMGLLDTGSGSPTLYIRQDDGNWCAVVMTRDSLT